MSLEKVEILIAQSRYDLAYDILREYLSTDTMNYKALHLMSITCIYLDKHDEAESVLQAKLQLYPDDPYNYYLSSFLQVKRKNFRKAHEAIDHAISIVPEDSTLFSYKSNIFLHEKNYEAAALMAEKALEIDPENTQALNNLYSSYQFTNQLNKADDALFRALELEPNNEVTHANLGYLSLSKGKVEDAMQHFRNSLVIDPECYQAQVGMKEAAKSKFLLYKWLLLFQLFLHRKGSQFSLYVMIGIVVLNNIIRSLAEQGLGFISYILYAIMTLLIIFVLSSWILNPIMTLVLYSKPRTRLSLTSQEKNMAKATMLSLAIILVSLPFLLIGKSIIFQILLMLGGISLIFYNNLFDEDDTKVKKIARIATALLIISCITILVFNLAQHQLVSTLLLIPLGIGVLYTWMTSLYINKNV